MTWGKSDFDQLNLAPSTALCANHGTRSTCAFFCLPGQM